MFGIPELGTFVGDLTQDLTAVMDVIITDFSNGPVEGLLTKSRSSSASCMADASLNS